MKESQYILSDVEIGDLILKMDTRIFDLAQLNPAKYNPRFIDDEALEGLGESLSSFGYLQPIIVNIRDDVNTVVGGHQRLKLLLKRGITKAECVIVDVDEITEKAMNVSLNNPEISGKWDLTKLEALTAELKEQLPNFDALQLSVLESTLELNMEDFSDFDQTDEQKDPKAPSIEQLFTIEIEFLPEDYELFMETVAKEEISFKTPVKKVQYGLKLAQFLRKCYQRTE